MGECRYKRVLLKLSGESFCQPGQFGIDGASLESLAERIAEICKLGPEVAIVVGAGNFIRGETFSRQSHIPRNTADYMGMLVTILNACALQETLDNAKHPMQTMNRLVEGEMSGFYTEDCLWEQPFVEDDSRSVEQVLTEAAKQTGGEAKIRRFVRFEVG